jgi:hypothetical protein
MLDHLILSNLKQQQTQKREANMNNILTAIQHYSDLMSTTKLQNELKKIDSSLGEVCQEVGAFLRNNWNGKLDDYIPCGFQIESLIEFTLTTQTQDGQVAITTSNSFYYQPEMQHLKIMPMPYKVFSSKDTFDLLISFEIKDGKRADSDNTYFHGSTHLRSSSLDEFISKSANITKDILIEDLKLSNIIDEDNLENTIDLFVQQIEY